MARIVRIGLEEGAVIDPNVLEQLLVEFEERLREKIVSRARRRLEALDIVVKAVYGDKKTLLVEVDIRAGGRPIAPLSYDELIAEALSEAGAWLENALRRAVSRGDQEGRGEAEGEEDSGNMP